ncbi:hypothetical protein L5G32_12410 [Gordonia sp. HY002]|nr:hypothetical protein [Gordonia zhenghanii]MCF8606238.1 hypothetical protein [Gordonia zhenghanii]
MAALAKGEDYRQIFWEFTGHSPFGKEIHHAIEQAIFKYFPNLFDEGDKDHPNNLRGFWLSDAPKIHRSAIRNALNYLYRTLGIDPRTPAPIPDSKLPGLRTGLMFGAVLIDILFGRWMVPVPPIFGSPIASNILESLGVPPDMIDSIEDADTGDLMRIFKMALIGWNNL